MVIVPVPPIQNINTEHQFPIIRSPNAMDTVFGTHEILENVLKHVAPQELDGLRSINSTFHDVITNSKTIKYITFREAAIPRSLHKEPDFLRRHTPQYDYQVHLHPFVDRLLRQFWQCALETNAESTVIDPWVACHSSIPTDIYVTRPPVKVMSFMFNNAEDLSHVVIESQGPGVTLQKFMETLSAPLFARFRNMISTGQRQRFPLPDICVSVRFRDPVSGPRNFHNQYEEDNVDIGGYRRDYAAFFVSENGSTQ
ncbi:hypothetical protein TWF281_004793 [Arthrobotrys megalospora]